MKIAVVRRNYNPYGGGAERYTAKVVEGLATLGHNITIFAEKLSGNISQNIEWIKVPKSNIPSLCRTVSFHKNTRKQLADKEFDIVYALSRTAPADIFRVTEQIHAEWMPVNYSKLAMFNPRHRGILKLEREVLSPKNTRFIVTNSKLVKHQVVERFRYPHERIQIIRNGVDKARFYPAQDGEKDTIREKLKLDRETMLLLFVAENFQIKGLSEAITSLAMLPTEMRERLKLLVAGGDDPTPFIKQAKKAGLENNILFTGRQKEMRPLYVASDLLLYPSLYEPFANVCLEACACGVSVVTTKQNGSSELIKHNVNGYIVPSPQDTKAIADAISNFIEMTAENRKNFSQKALEATLDYTWEKHIDTLNKLFIATLKEKETSHR